MHEFDPTAAAERHLVSAATAGARPWVVGLGGLVDESDDVVGIAHRGSITSRVTPSCRYWSTVAASTGPGGGVTVASQLAERCGAIGLGSSPPKSLDTAPRRRRVP